MIYTSKTCDFVVTLGSVCLLTPISDEARDWVNDNLGPDNGYQPYYPSVVIEPRYLSDILDGIKNDGLKVVRTNR